jgi:hypothetical protein
VEQAENHENLPKKSTLVVGQKPEIPVKRNPLYMITSSRANSCLIIIPTLLTLTCLLLLVSGCATPTTQDNAFSEQYKIKGNSESIPASMDATWGSVLEVMAERGWLMQQADTKSHVILATREIRDKDDKTISHSLSGTVTLVPVSEQVTHVIVAANVTTELHKKSHDWWHLLWLIPIFPTGTEYTTVVVNRDTVQNPQLYADFFDAVTKKCNEKKALSTPASAP